MLQMLRLLQVLRIVGEGNRQSKGRGKSTSLRSRGEEREGRLTGSGERGFFLVDVEGPKVFKSECTVM